MTSEEFHISRLPRDVQQPVAEAIIAAREAGRILVRRFRTGVSVRMKGVADIVTATDVEAQGVVVRRLRRRFPGHGILAEEGLDTMPSAEWRWILDPLDGTKNFARGIPTFCVSIAAEYRGRVELGVVFDPIHDEMFVGVRRHRAWCNGRRIRVSVARDLRSAFLATGCPHRVGQFMWSVGLTFGRFAARSLGVRDRGAGALALALALLINQKIRGLTIYRALLFYPTMIPMAAAAMIWLWILTPNYGLLNYYGKWLGLPDVHWLGHSKLAIWALVLVGVWKRVGYYMVIYLAGLQVIPDHLYEAARIEGAGPWQRFWRVTVPLVSPTTFFVGIMAVIDAFQAIDQVYLMTRGGPGNSTNLVIFYIYQNAFRFFDFGYASAVSAVLFLILLALTLLAFRTLHRKVHYA